MQNFTQTVAFQDQDQTFGAMKQKPYCCATTLPTVTNSVTCISNSGLHILIAVKL